MQNNRRDFLLGAAAAAVGMGAAVRSTAAPGDAPIADGARISNPIAVSTYSYWRYHADSKLKIEQCIDLAGATGFDAVEIL